jgi:hypothetical protein
MAKKAEQKYRTTQDIIIPAGTIVARIPMLQKEVPNVATAVVSVGNHMHFDWIMWFDDAVKAGLIEKADEHQD